MTESPAVLVVDDEAVSRRLAAQVLSARGYRCSTAADAQEALVAVDADSPDVVVTDMSMPDTSGLELVAAIRERHPRVATVMLTAHDGDQLVAAALDGGVYGYVTKPFEPSALVIAVSCAVQRRDVELENARHRAALTDLVRIRTEELEESRAEAVQRLALAVESRDPGTGAHVERMSSLSARIAAALGWSDPDCDTLRLASVLHDVGKMVFPTRSCSSRGRSIPKSGD